MAKALTIKKVIKRVTKRTGVDSEIVRAVLAESVSIMADNLFRGNDLKLRHIGTLTWSPRKARKRVLNGVTFEAREGRVLRLKPASALRKVIPMEDEGMTKYAVITEEQDESKQASKENTCYICGTGLDDGGACPKCGTEPFEKRDKA